LGPGGGSLPAVKVQLPPAEKKRHAESKAPPMVSKYIVPKRHIEIYEADIRKRVTRRVTPIECAGIKLGEVN
jgi:hypothetical protein